MVILHNLSAINTYRHQNINQSNLSRNLEKLSSGYRVNRAGDNAAGLAISESMRRQIAGLKQAENNTRDGINLIRTADGAMAEISGMLRRMMTISTQAANGTYDELGREALQMEVDELKKEINRITEFTDFDGIRLLKDGVKEDRIKVVHRINADIVPRTELPAWVIRGSAFQEEDGHLDEIITEDVYDQTSAISGECGGSLDFSALNETNVKELIGTGFYVSNIPYKYGWGTGPECVDYGITYYSILFTEGTDATWERSGNHYITSIGIDNVKTAGELVNLLREKLYSPINGHCILVSSDAVGQGGEYCQIFFFAGFNGNVIALQQTNYDHSTQEIYKQLLAKGYGSSGVGIAVAVGTAVPSPDRTVNDIRLQIGPSSSETLECILPWTDTAALSIDGLSVRTQESASDAVDAVKDAVDFLSGERGRMGSYANRLEHTLRFLTNTGENLTAAESRIRDTDMADEITGFARNQILLEAAQAMLTQANSTPWNVLKLL